MNKFQLKVSLESFKETNFEMNLRDLSPIPKENQKNTKNPKPKHQKDETSPGSRNTCPNSIIKSFSSCQSENLVIDFDELQEITHKVRRMEENLDVNLYLLQEKLALNQKLNEKLMILEKLKAQNDKFFADDVKVRQSCNERCSVF